MIRDHSRVVCLGIALPVFNPAHLRKVTKPYIAPGRSRPASACIPRSESRKFDGTGRSRLRIYLSTERREGVLVKINNDELVMN